MEVPCVRVPLEEGERMRERLARADLVDRDHEITVEDGSISIPITDATAVEEPVVSREVTPRERQQMPADLLAEPPSYERLGDIALLEEDDPDRAATIADAIVESDLPIETVLNKASPVQGTERVREWDVLVGESTEAVHREYGCEFALDLAAVYFSPRLATERHRVAEQVSAGERAFDMFAGVGPFVIPFATRGATCVGVDINEAAIAYLEENAKRNDVADRVTGIVGDVSAVAPEYADWADRIVMNLPHDANQFLESARIIAGESCILHYYDIQPEEDAYGPGEQAIREAFEPAYAVTVETRQEVRSYAPHELNVCLDVRLEQR
ncbi:MAG: class I SAM-dependent methyltransferase family protein [Natrialbaceae archaeon]|nr:class I SAM-dependent methyltransferase family protein [Natrialbaceae archaeon]